MKVVTFCDFVLRDKLLVAELVKKSPVLHRTERFVAMFVSTRHCNLF
jgi:hypothetical protein